MARRRKRRSDPELLVVSFCDIVTITTAALFFCLIVTVQWAVKVPIFRPTPLAKVSTKQGIFFECRNDQLYFVDKTGLDGQVEDMMSKLKPGVRGGDLDSVLKAIQGQDIGNAYYKVDPQYLLVGQMGLEPRAGVSGEGPGDFESPDSKYRERLSLLDKDKQYIAFLVRDDSFNAFRKARQVADSLGLDTGWELLGTDEPIKFGAGGTAISTQ
jgi:hypothetical protein